MVNDQDQRSKKMAIKMIQGLGWILEGQKLGPFLVIKFIKDYSYQNMSIIKVALLFIYSSMNFF